MRRAKTSSLRPLQDAIAATLRHVLLAALAMGLAMGMGAVRAANVDSCGASLQSGTLPRLDFDKAKQVQEALIQIYRNDPLFPRTGDHDRALLADGKIGPVTKAWLWRFCRDFSVPAVDADSRTIVDAVLNFSAIVTDHPEWQSELMSARLSKCIDAQPKGQRVKDLTSRIYGSDEDIDALMLKCRNERATADVKQPVFVSDAMAQFYKLTAADRVLLAGPDKVLAAIEKIQANPPGDDKEFEAEVAKALEEAKLPVKQYLPVIQRHARYFQLTADSIKKLRAKGLPPAIIDIASSQQDLPFLTREKLAAALALASVEQADKAAAQKDVEEKAEADKAAAERAAEAKAAAEKIAAAKVQAKQAEESKLSVAKTAAEKATDARLAADVAEAEKTAAEKNLAARTAALEVATEKAAAAKEAARVAEEEKAAADKVLAGRLPLFKGAAQKAATEKAALAKVAADAAAAAQAAVKEASSAKAAAQETVAAKTTLAKAAAEKLAATKTASKEAVSERTAAEDTAHAKAATAKAAAARAAAAKDAAKQASLAKSAAEKSAAEAANARRLPPFLAATEKALAEKTAAAQAAAQKAADANAAAAAADVEKTAAESAADKRIAAAKAAAAKAAEAKTAAQEAAAQKAAAEKHAVAQATALIAARRRATEAADLAKKAEAEKVAAEAAAARRLPFFGGAAAKSAVEKAAIAKFAAEQAVTAKASVEEAAVAKAAADDAVAVKTAEAKSAAGRAQDAKAAAEEAAAAKAAADKRLVANAATLKTATAQAAAAMAAASKAADEKAAAEKLAADQIAASRMPAAMPQPTPPTAPPPSEGAPLPSVLLAPYLADILEVAVSTRGYRLTPALTNDLRADPEFGAVPAFVIAVLKGMEEVEYPNYFLFEQAVKARIVDAFTREAVRGEASKVVKTPDEVRPLNPPPDILAVYDAVQKARLAGQNADKILPADKKWRDDMREKLWPLITPYMTAIEAAARESRPWEMNKPFNWKSDGCGCVGEQLPGAIGSQVPGVTYGIFPFWQGRPDQPVDFRTLSAAAIFALPFDDKGELRDPLEERFDFDFVKAARAHGTRIDWVIQRLDWRTWQKPDIGAMTAMFNNLAERIDKMLRKPASGWLNEQLHRFSMGAIPRLRRGDGVTLYFDNYPNDAEAVTAFNAFHAKLNDTLRETVGKDYAVNLLFSRTALGSGIFECRNLIKLMHRKDGTPQTINNVFLVLIEEPTTDSKKELRQYVESCLHGTERRDLLRVMVPVVEYDRRSDSQLQDDVIYADQNFRGIGFWSYPGSAAVVTDNQKKGEPESGEDAGRGIASLLLRHTEVDGLFCGVVCPMRWWVRGLLLLLGAVLAVSLLVGAWNCRLGASFGGHSKYANYVLGILILALLLFTALFLCDPSLAEIRSGNKQFFVAMAVIIAIGFWLRGRAIRQSRLP